MNLVNFGEALEALRAGKRVTRDGWSGAIGSAWIALWVPGTYRFNSEALENCAPLVAYAKTQRSQTVDVGRCFIERCPDGSITFGWQATTIDILANDWVVLS